MRGDADRGWIASGDAFVTDYTFSNDFPVTAGAFQTGHGSGLSTSAFIAELNATGTAFVYSSYLGDKNGSGTGIAVDGNAYLQAAPRPRVSRSPPATPPPNDIKRQRRRIPGQTESERHGPRLRHVLRRQRR